MDTRLGISIIIPAYNEAEGLGQLLSYLNQIIDKNVVKEIILVDGQSTDTTRKVAANQNVIVLDSPRGRAKQMNLGAQIAENEILYFLHADTYPPKDFDKLILDAMANGYEAGCFRMKFDTQNPVLRFFAHLSRINHALCRGGDQSLFISKTGFLRNGGFNENYFIYEDTEFIKRLYKDLKFKILPQNVITSARKYREKGWLKVQFHFGMIHLKNYLGATPDELYKYYRKNLLT